jgi:hypothetical protein
MSELTHRPATVQAAWDNHFSGFGGQDIDKIMLDYTETSVLENYDHASSRRTTFTGKAQIRQFFLNLFAQLTNLTSLAAPIVEVTESPQKQVYLIWSCPSSGVESATDTFIFDDNNRISRQNIALTSGTRPNAFSTVARTNVPSAANPVPVNSSYSQATVRGAWDNHFTAFGGQNITKIMQDYTSHSVLKAFDHTTGTLATAVGWGQIQQFFVNLFATLSDTSTLAAPVIAVTERPDMQVSDCFFCLAIEI